VARKAPKEASKEAQKLKSRARLRKISRNLAQRKQKYMRYANATLKLDLIRVSLGNCRFLE